MNAWWYILVTLRRWLLYDIKFMYLSFIFSTSYLRVSKYPKKASPSNPSSEYIEQNIDTNELE